MSNKIRSKKQGICNAITEVCNRISENEVSPGHIRV